MKLPVDADGVPIRPGDKVMLGNFAPVITGVGGETVTLGQPYLASDCRHFKPDTVAEELAKFLSACGDDDPHYYDEEIAEFAERIRKVMHDGD